MSADITAIARLGTAEERQAAGERLRRAREILGYNQTRLAEAIGASKRGLQDNEAGKSVPGGQVLAGLAALGINVNWLLTGEGPERLEDTKPVEAPSQVPRLDGAMMGRALAAVRRLLKANGFHASDEGEGELAAILYEMYQHGMAWQAAEHAVSTLMRTTTSRIGKDKQGTHERQEH